MTQSNVSLEQKSLTWWKNLSIGEKNHYKHMYPNTDGFLSDKEIETIYLKEHPTEAEVGEEEEAVERAASKYVHKNFPSYIMGSALEEIFKSGANWQKEQDRELISELLDGLKKMYAELNNETILLTSSLSYDQIWEINEAITKAEKHLNNQ